jgi:hypothetical protein
MLQQQVQQCGGWFRANRPKRGYVWLHVSCSARYRWACVRIRVKEALQEYGVTSDSVQHGDNATWSSGFHELTAKQQEMVSAGWGCHTTGKWGCH